MFLAIASLQECSCAVSLTEIGAILYKWKFLGGIPVHWNSPAYYRSFAFPIRTMAQQLETPGAQAVDLVFDDFRPALRGRVLKSAGPLFSRRSNDTL